MSVSIKTEGDQILIMFPVAEKESFKAYLFRAGLAYAWDGRRKCWTVDAGIATRHVIVKWAGSRGLALTDWTPPTGAEPEEFGPAEPAPPVEPEPMVITHLTANVRDPNAGEGRWSNHRIGWLPEEGWFCTCAADKDCLAIAVVQRALCGAVGNAERPTRRGAGGKAPRKPRAAQKAAEIPQN